MFKSFFDVLDPKFLDGMPVLFGATGGSSRHSLVLDMAIRPLFSYLRANTMPTAIYASPEDWGTAGTQSLERRIGQGAGELAAVLAQFRSGTTPAGTDTPTRRPPRPRHWRAAPLWATGLRGTIGATRKNGHSAKPST